MTRSAARRANRNARETAATVIALCPQSLLETIRYRNGAYTATSAREVAPEGDMRTRWTNWAYAAELLNRETAEARR